MHLETHLSVCRFKLNKHWNKDKSEPAWMFEMETPRGDTSGRLGHDFAITGTVEGRLHRGRMYATVENVFPEWECGSDGLTSRLRLISKEFEFIRVTRPETIWVRLNTEWLHDPSYHPWRILTFTDGHVMEQYARGFRIHGYSYGVYHNFGEPTGEKMHIGCRGELIWDSEGNAFIAATRPEEHVLVR